MVPLLEGLDGVQKMSKSLGNYIGITDAPNDMFGKIMSISDELMWRYYDLLSFKPIADINALKQQVAGGANPRDIKILLAKEIIARFHDEAAAEAAHQDFTQRFSKNALPDDIPQLSIQCDSGSMPIANLLKEAGLVDSTSEAIRMIKQGAVKLNGETKIEDTKLEVVKGSTEIYQVGKRKFAKISLI
jgi:tyrosyl-tRNA synthetase